ncbi:unnamed protein product [Onchocerca ochengi]|uniref:WW domain-containing protein n=1 Tax=Onchocerca ochengi TaxID=42157 RepID=A0A182ECS0_ONCOC|nr:unnamed protein product [Onchocerca ochengi]
MSKKKKEIHVPGLLEPWKAYYSKKRKRIFYFNMETKETTWEMPVVKSSLTESDLYPVLKQLNAKHQQGISGLLEKKDVSCQKSLDPWEADVRRMSNNCKHSLDIPSTSEPNEELMEVDEINMEEINCPEEPMEVDFVVGEVQAFRREHFLHPNPCTEDNAPFYDAAKYTEVYETTKNAGIMLIVFDTSCLLQDTALLPMCIQRAYCSLIPYTVLQELDGLKKATSDELRSKVVKTIAYLHDCIKRRCNYLFIENTFEASDSLEEFGCRNNDDIILKCAFVTTKKYEKEPIRVVFATNDKNLAVKAAAHNIITADRNELLHLLTTDSPNEKSQQFIIRNASQKVSLPDFSFVVDKPSSSIVGTMEVAATKKAMDRLLVPFECQSSSLSITSVPQKEEISSYNSTSSIAISDKIKDESRNFIRRKKKCHEASSSIEQRRNHQSRLAPYSIRKAREEVIKFG